MYYVDPCNHIPRGPSWPVMRIPLLLPLHGLSYLPSCIERTETLEDLKLLKEHLHEIKEESFYSQKEEHCYINKQVNVDIR